MPRTVLNTALRCATGASLSSAECYAHKKASPWHSSKGAQSRANSLATSPVLDKNVHSRLGRSGRLTIQLCDRAALKGRQLFARVDNGPQPGVPRCSSEPEAVRVPPTQARVGVQFFTMVRLVSKSAASSAPRPDLMALKLKS